jgi:hypothetical protein
MPTVNVTRVASALNLSEQRIQQLVKEGMPRESRGKYDPVKCMCWYIRYLQLAIERRAVPALDGAFVGERQERHQVLRVAADLKEMELPKERGLVIAISDYERTSQISFSPPRRGSWPSRSGSLRSWWVKLHAS